MESKAEIWILDDDAGVRESLAWLLESMGWLTRSWSCPLEFLASLKQGEPQVPVCLLLDVRMPGMSGLELLEHLVALPSQVPVILLTGHGDVPMAVRALKAGAVDFFEKPFNDQQLLDSINKALFQHQQQLQQQAEQQVRRAQLEQLTAREKQVLALMLEGLPSKRMADRLNISPKTIDVHRHQVMQKLESASLAELIKLYSPLFSPS